MGKLRKFLLMVLSQDLISFLWPNSPFLWPNSHFSSMIQGFKDKKNDLEIHYHKFLLPAIDQ